MEQLSHMLSPWFEIRHMIPTVTKLDSRNLKVDTDDCFIYKRTLLLMSPVISSVSFQIM